MFQCFLKPVVSSICVTSAMYLQWKSFYQGPGGVWCDVDVVEFSYFGAPEPAPKEQLYTEIVDDLRGGDPCIGSGSQVFIKIPFQPVFFPSLVVVMLH